VVSVKDAGGGDVWLAVLVSRLQDRVDGGDLMAELVLELGDLEGPVPRPAGMRRGRQGYCFANASRRACDDDAGRYLLDDPGRGASPCASVTPSWKPPSMRSSTRRPWAIPSRPALDLQEHAGHVVFLPLHRLKEILFILFKQLTELA
jgi:hypothetical protein